MRILTLCLLLISSTLAWAQGRPTVTVDTGNCALSGTYNGGIGCTHPDTGQGVGFQYPKYTPSCLYHGSFLVANSESTVHDHFYIRPPPYLQWDWVVRDTFVDIIPPLFGAHELYKASMVDTSRPTQAQGFLVTHWWGGRGISSPAYDDFVIVRYDIRNNSPSQIDSIYAGVFVDFDLGTSPTTNWGRSDSARRLTYMRPSSTNHNPSVGVKLLEPYTAANLSLIDRSYYIFDWGDTVKWRFLNGTYRLPNSLRAYDYTICVSAGPINLAPGQWVRTGFAIIGATDSLSLKVHADTAQAWWDRDWKTGIEEDRSRRLEAGNEIQIQPNPFRRLTKISSSIGLSAGSAALKIYDAAGNLVKQSSRLATMPFRQITWNGEDSSGKPLPAGVYFIRLETATNNYTKKVLLLR